MANSVSTTKPLLTTKITLRLDSGQAPDTKVSESLFLNFVLFVSFVVKTIFASWVAALPRWDFRGENRSQAFTRRMPTRALTE
jgi:hypothetical protein